MANIYITQISQNLEEGYIKIEGFDADKAILTIDFGKPDEQWEPKTTEFFFWQSAPGQMNCLKSCCFKAYKKIYNHPEYVYEEIQAHNYIAGCINHTVWLPDDKEKKYNGTLEKAEKQFKKYLASLNSKK